MLSIHASLVHSRLVNSTEVPVFVGKHKGKIIDKDIGIILFPLSFCKTEQVI